MNFTRLIILLSLFNLSICGLNGSSPNVEHNSADQEDAFDEDLSLKEMTLAAFLYQKFKDDFDMKHNKAISSDKNTVTYEYDLSINEADDWKLVTKINGMFTFGNSTKLPVKLQLLKFLIFESNDEMTEDQKWDYYKPSTEELNTLETPYQVLLTCNDCKTILEQIGEDNDGVHINDHFTNINEDGAEEETGTGLEYDSINYNVNDNGDGSFTMSLMILLPIHIDVSQDSYFVNDLADDESIHSEQYEDIDQDEMSIQQINTLRFGEGIKNAQSIDSDLVKANLTKKILV